MNFKTGVLYLCLGERDYNDHNNYKDHNKFKGNFDILCQGVDVMIGC